jgi:hypothetical protein
MLKESSHNSSQEKIRPQLGQLRVNLNLLAKSRVEGSTQTTNPLSGTEMDK